MDGIKLPEAFVQRMKKMLQDEWEAFEDSYLHHNYQALRFNILKKGIDKGKYGEILSELHIEERQPVLWAENAFYYSGMARPGKHPYHEMGMYYIQEPSAMSAAALLKPQPGERVLDLCAAPGGKSTQLASCLNGEGLLIANEIHPDRCKILSQNIERMGIANAIVLNEDCERLARRFPGYFHKIQVDAPCSGEGMFRKNYEAVSEWSEEQVRVCADRQLMILNEAATMLMPGGTMVYSTCTFAPEENEELIDRFLGEHEEFELTQVDVPYFDRGKPEWGNGREELLRTFRLFPHHLHGEGHFVAVLHKKGILYHQMPDIKIKMGKKGGKLSLEKKQMEEFMEFTGSVLQKEMEEFILNGKLVLFGEQLHRLAADAPDLQGLKVLRAGLHLGTFKKNRFEPSHALALFLGMDDVKQSLNLQLDAWETAAFFRGETIGADCGKGYCLVCVDGYSAGWGKISNGQLKNHYPIGLRKNFEHEKK